MPIILLGLAIAGLIRRLGVMYCEMHKLEEASKSYTRGMDMLAKFQNSQGTRYYEEYALFQQLMGNILIRGDNKREALKYYDEALLLLEKVFGKGSTRTAITLNSIGATNLSLYISNKEENELHLNKAKEAYQQAFSISLEEKNTNAILMTGGGLAYISLKEGNSLEAMRYAKKSLEVCETSFEENSLRRAQNYNNAAYIFFKSGDFKTADNYLTEAQRGWGGHPNIYLYHSSRTHFYIKRAQNALKQGNEVAFLQNLKNAETEFEIFKLRIKEAISSPESRIKKLQDKLNKLKSKKNPLLSLGSFPIRSSPLNKIGDLQEYDPPETTQVAYLYHQGVHFQALVPNSRRTYTLASSSQREQNTQSESPRRWSQGKYIAKSYTFKLPVHNHESFIESYPKKNDDLRESMDLRQEESYLTCVWKKLDGHLIQDSTVKKCVISGLGGMGKSRLARAYVHKALVHGIYDAIFWFQLNREMSEEQNKSSLESQYREFFAVIEENIKTDITTQVLLNLFKNKVAQRFQRPLIIYDDVPLGNYFLKSALPELRAHIIVTSRDTLGWVEDEVIPPLSGLQQEESVKFLQKKSGRELKDERDDASKIAVALGGLPLALEQAASWIKVKTQPYSRYLAEFSIKAKELMTYKSKNSDYPHVVATTWAVTMNSVSELARELMRYFAYLKSDNIPLILFKALAPENAIDELVQYSMIQRREEDNISIHQLVQLVNRNDSDFKVVESLMNLFINTAIEIFQANLDDPQERTKILKYLPHAAKLHEYVKELTSLNEELLKKFRWIGVVCIRVIKSIHIKIPVKFSLEKGVSESDKFQQEKIKKRLEESTSLLRDFQGKEDDEAFKWLMGIARSSHAFISYCMGTLYTYGVGLLKPNTKNALEWYNLAADKGNLWAQCNLGFIYLNNEGELRNPEEAAKWYKLAAEQGNGNAQFNLAKMYSQGIGVERNLQESNRLYKLAAKHKDLVAQLNAGLRYTNVSGITQDFEEALKWYEIAAEENIPYAIYGLGFCYDRGLGSLKKDPNKASLLYKRFLKLCLESDEQKDATIQCLIAVMYVSTTV